MEGKSGASSRGNSSSNSVFKVVAVKKLVVEVWSRTLGLLHCLYLTVRDFLLGERPPSGGPEQDYYFEKIRVFKAGHRPEYISME